jgi:hypothetical protein
MKRMSHILTSHYFKFTQQTTSLHCTLCILTRQRSVSYETKALTFLKRTDNFRSIYSSVPCNYLEDFSRALPVCQKSQKYGMVDNFVFLLEFQMHFIVQTINKQISSGLRFSQRRCSWCKSFGMTPCLLVSSYRQCKRLVVSSWRSINPDFNFHLFSGKWSTPIVPDTFWENL